MDHETGALRVVLYSHDSQGLGHVRRNLALAHALADRLPELTGRPVTGLLLTGLDGMGSQAPAGFDTVSLPSLHKTAGRYAPRHLRVPMSDLLAVRSSILDAALTGFAPDLVVVDRHAYGVDGELRPALRRLRAERPEALVILGLRDVLDSPAVVAKEWAEVGDLDEVRQGVDEIWVYGDPRVHDLRRTGEIPAPLARRARYTGYLSSGRWSDPAAARQRRPYVVTMVGGGSDGERLCGTAARAAVPAGHRHVVVTGPQMPAGARERIRALATGRTRVVATVPDGLTTIREAAAVVAMAGYNTTTELMSTTVPGLLVPRERPRREQAIRAGALAGAGAVDTVAQDDLTAEALGDWFAGAVASRADRSHIDRDGLAAVARRAAELLAARSAAVREESSRAV